VNEKSTSGAFFFPPCEVFGEKEQFFLSLKVFFPIFEASNKSLTKPNENIITARLAHLISAY
jgi:hypothetical protein